MDQFAQKLKKLAILVRVFIPAFLYLVPLWVLSILILTSLWISDEIKNYLFITLSLIAFWVYFKKLQIEIKKQTEKYESGVD